VGKGTRKAKEESGLKHSCTKGSRAWAAAKTRPLWEKKSLRLVFRLREKEAVGRKHETERFMAGPQRNLVQRKLAEEGQGEVFDVSVLSETPEAAGSQIMVIRQTVNVIWNRSRGKGARCTLLRFVNPHTGGMLRIGSLQVRALLRLSGPRAQDIALIGGSLPY